eukprot:GEMP01007676.1.p1 GENE.GEMP01007676.1~~GEMP01007676.1.p1  ORF type:complete len:353 (+),score=68.83 GEMP01007676.1:67-1125(+)
MLLDLPEGPFCALCDALGLYEFCAMDSTSKALRDYMVCLEVWRLKGIECYSHIALIDVTFDAPAYVMGGVPCFRPLGRSLPADPPSPPTCSALPRHGPIDCTHDGATGGVRELRMRRIPSPVGMHSSRKSDWRPLIDWKARFRHFYHDQRCFREPFNGSRVTNLTIPDAVAYMKANLINGSGIYCEVEVKVNADNLSLSVVDFDAGGRSSVTFSPDTGAVIKETKVQECPRLVNGTYAQCLRQTTSRFHGSMGLYLKDGMLAFFRKGPEPSDPWATTHFCTTIDVLKNDDGKTWSITPCLAFRDQGEYDVSIVKVSRTPPIEPMKVNVKWQELNWDGEALVGNNNLHPLAVR